MKVPAARDIVGLAGIPAAAMLMAVGALGPQHAGAQSPPEQQAPQAVHDAWIDGRLETAYELNQQLRAFTIDTTVNGGVVTLSGKVESEIDRELAADIAAAAPGVSEVKSSLTVDSGLNPMRVRRPDGEGRAFGQWVDDATSTARVKSNLVANGNTKGLSIDVDTENDVVILRGAVPSRKDKMLAEMIARNTDGIANVRNQLEINEQT